MLFGLEKHACLGCLASNEGVAMLQASTPTGTQGKGMPVILDFTTQNHLLCLCRQKGQKRGEDACHVITCLSVKVTQQPLPLQGDCAVVAPSRGACHIFSCFALLPNTSKPLPPCRQAAYSLHQEGTLTTT